MACASRTDLLRVLVHAFGYTSYLEVGCRKNETFDAIDVVDKVGVDPIEGGTHRMTSDDFFATSKRSFDLVFIDGDHHHTQALRDVASALAHLNPNGTVVMHDCSPPDASHEGRRNWKCGTAWRAFAWLRQCDNLEAIVADWDYGSGIIRFGTNDALVRPEPTMDEMTYADFDAHRVDWMRLRDHVGVADWLMAQKQRTAPGV